MESKQYFVYILSSISKVLYIGVTNDLRRRVLEHKNEVLKVSLKSIESKNWFILK